VGDNSTTYTQESHSNHTPAAKTETNCRQFFSRERVIDCWHNPNLKMSAQQTKKNVEIDEIEIYGFMYRFDLDCEFDYINRTGKSRERARSDDGTCG
jgi:hypothetical protein